MNPNTPPSPSQIIQLPPQAIKPPIPARPALQPMEIESAKCECCGLKEDCTAGYIGAVKANFDGKWLCGLCAEAVMDEAGSGVDEAVTSHMSFCRKFRLNPAVKVADGMRQMLRRRSALVPSSAAVGPKKFGRSMSASS